MRKVLLAILFGTTLFATVAIAALAQGGEGIKQLPKYNPPYTQACPTLSLCDV